MASDRRQFLTRAGLAGSALGTGSFLQNLPAVSAQEVGQSTALVPLDSGIEPTVRLIEQTPRAEIIETIAGRIKDGLSYREVLGGLLLAGVRNVQPRPAVGFKFHSVLVVNSAHLASLASPDEDRWLPILWALDYFKATQAEEARQSGWRMEPVNESQIPAPSQARAAFVQAMDSWNAEAADVAVAGLVRSSGRNELFELFCRYGARDYRSIGHKAIYVANSFRTLDCIGWEHAEPVMRSLAFALLNHSGEASPAKSDLEPDRPWRFNQERVEGIPETWLGGGENKVASLELVAALREASADDASRAAVEALNSRVSAQGVWDAVLLSAGELLMRQPGIIGLHAVTTANALRYAFQTNGEEETRKMLLLQACSFLPMFRASAAGRGGLANTTVAALANGEANGDAVAEPRIGDTQESIDQIFSQVSRDRQQAAQSLYQYMQAGGSAEAIMNEARRLVFLKGRDAHDYKFSSAVLEDYYQVSPGLRDQFLALSVFNLRGSQDRDNDLVTRMRAAL
jgi:hypothetical protein